MNDGEIIERKCIICLETKATDQFNEEHIFPAALGGAIIIKSVCKKCNGDLGRVIDQPFLTHPLVSYYRNIFDLTRNEGRRKGFIPNPMKSTVTDSRGNKYRVEFKNKKPHAEVIERLTFEKDEKRNGYIAEITIAKDKMEDLDSIVKKLAKRQGFELADYKIESQEVYPAEPLTVTINSENNKFIFGCMKIAYESMMNLFPFYYEDAVAKWICKTILTATCHRRHKKILDRNNPELMKRYDILFKNIKGIEPIHHAVVIENINGVGLVCCVRIFNWFYPIVMSLNMRLIPEGQSIFIYNDAKNREYSSNVQHSISNTKITVDLLNLSEEIIKIIKKEQDKAFYNSDGIIAIYDSKGEVLYKNPEELCLDKLQKHGSHFSWLERNFNIDVKTENYFLKTKSDKMVKLLSLATERQIILQKVT